MAGKRGVVMVTARRKSKCTKPKNEQRWIFQCRGSAGMNKIDHGFRQGQKGWERLRYTAFTDDSHSWHVQLALLDNITRLSLLFSADIYKWNSWTTLIDNVLSWHLKVTFLGSTHSWHSHVTFTVIRH